MQHSLNPAFVKSVQSTGAARRYGDGNGLYLLVNGKGKTRKSWVQRLTVDGKERELGLGSVDRVSLREARRLARENRKTARAGGDPRRRTGVAPTFAEALEAVIAIHQPTWKGGERLAAHWRSSLGRHAFPRIGATPVDAVTAADVLAILAPIWAGQPSVGRVVLRRIGTVMNWAVAQGHRRDNPAGDVVVAALPRVPTRHAPRAALPHPEVGAAIARVRASTSALPIRLAFEFQVLCAARPSEARCARWEQVDLDAATWTLPPGGTKTGLEHRVPLAPRAVAVLREALPERGDWVFPSPVTGRPFASDRLATVLKSLDIHAVPHGFRSSFRDWAAERTDAPRAVMEAALGHAAGSVTEAAYARSDLFDRRRLLMAQWADYLAGPQPDVAAPSFPGRDA